MDLDAYDFELPAELIAQEPPAERDGGRLLCVPRAGGPLAHRRVRDLPALLDPGDLLVVNVTRVLPARLRGHKDSGGAAEALLLGPGPAPDSYEAFLKTSGRQRVGQKLAFEGRGARFEAEVVALPGDGRVVLRFEPGVSPYAAGEAPLPPYIRREASDPADDARYQTVFAREAGAVAAPTAGLHLSDRVLEELAARGVERAEVVLHVGPGTFQPLQEEQLRSKRLHVERFELPDVTADAIAAARERGNRVVAVGTTSTRVLESCASGDGNVAAARGTTDLFLTPGDPFQVVDALLTNFHLPRSSLLLLVAALIGRERLLDAYREAIAERYRFYSYGDAMLIQ
ncbi:MAG: tRNA preQ1(34) S-adenosylmethionine ribosyltransferase-isomerase QueA [Myxococcota bacterium]